MSESEGEKEWITNWLYWKRMLPSSVGYNLPLLAQLLFSSSWYVFPLGSVGEQFLRTEK